MRHGLRSSGTALSVLLLTLTFPSVASAQSATSITSIAPTSIGAGTTPVMTFVGAVPSGTTAAAFAFSTQCLSGRVGETSLPASDTATLGSPIATPGPYKVCYTEDGATWIEQASPLLAVVQAFPSSITAIDPSSIVENTAVYMTFTGAQPTPTTEVAFALSGQCMTARQAQTSLSSTDSDYVSPGVSPPGLYAVCYTTDGVNWVQQSAVQLTVSAAPATTTTSTTTTLPPAAIDDYNCYKAKDLRNPRFSQIADLNIADEFASVTGDAKKPFLVCVPAELPMGAGLVDPQAYQCCYKLSAPKLDPAVELATTDSFGSLEVEIKKPKILCRPCQADEIP